MGGASTKQLATRFGSDEGSRGPTLGTLLFEGPEAGSWRVVLVTPISLQVFKGHDATAVPLEERTLAAINDHRPFTSFCVSEDTIDAGSEEAKSKKLALGCQDGTIMLFELSEGTVKGPLLQLALQDGAAAPHGRGHEDSITAVLLHSGKQVFAGTLGRCACWDLQTGELQREFHLPGGQDSIAAPSSLALVQEAETAQLWVGSGMGTLAVFEIQSGMLVRSLDCSGPEVVVGLSFCHRNRLVFALSAHRRVSIWDPSSYSCMQKYTAELMTCGSDLSSMATIYVPSLEKSMLLLAGVDGSLCIRRISRRPGDGKISCVLMWYLEDAGSDVGCPITALRYHPATDSVLLGDAGCNVTLLPKLQEQLGSAVNIVEPARRRAAAQTATQSNQDSEVSVEPEVSREAEEEAGEAPAEAYAEAAELREASDARDGYPGTSSSEAAFPVFSGS